MVFNQKHWPGAGDIDDCWVVSAIQAANAVAPWLRLPSVPVFRAAAGNPDKPGPTGGNLADIVQGCETLWPRYFKDRLKRLRGAAWNDFAAHVNAEQPVSVATVSAKLPPRLRFGFAGMHQITVARSGAGQWLVANPLAPVYSRWIEVNPAELKPAVMAYGRAKAGTSGAWAVVFPDAEEMSQLYWGQQDPTPFDQDDIDAATQELRERIDDARDVLDGVSTCVDSRTSGDVSRRWCWHSS